MDETITAWFEVKMKLIELKRQYESFQSFVVPDRGLSKAIMNKIEKQLSDITIKIIYNLTYTLREMN